MSLPKVIGVFRLARDVEMRYSQSGSAIANFSVVSSKKYKTQSGEQKEETVFIDCSAFGRLGEICNQYLSKGSQVYIVGEMKHEKWEKDGQKRSKHSITIESLEMLGNKDNSTGGNGYGKQGESNYSAPAQNNYSQPSQQPSNIPDIDINDDEIPF